MSPEILLDSFGQLLLSLYAAGDALSFPDFQREALRLVQAVLPFDSALWTAGAPDARGVPVAFSIYLFNQPQEMLVSYEQIKDRDPVAAMALARVGITINFPLAGIAREAGDEVVLAHPRRYGMQHTLATVSAGPVTGLMTFICLYRSNPANPFSETERLLKQNLMSHLVGLCNRSRLRHLEEALHPGLERRRRSAALIDRKGVLYNTDPGFVDLVLAEWPDWHGPTLPPALFDTVITGAATYALFSKTVAHSTAVNDLLLLHLREITPADRLSRREWDVAVAFGNGLTHKEIAKQLGIAPGTVRNHLSTVYEKLGVNNKAELVHILRAAPR